MAEFSGDEDPLPPLEDFLVDRIDDLEVSIGELSIDGKCSNRWYFLMHLACYTEVQV